MKIVKKSLSLVLALALLVSMFAITTVVNSSAAGTVALAWAANLDANWGGAATYNSDGSVNLKWTTKSQQHQYGSKFDVAAANAALAEAKAGSGFFTFSMTLVSCKNPSSPTTDASAILKTSNGLVAGNDSSWVSVGVTKVYDVDVSAKSSFTSNTIIQVVAQNYSMPSGVGIQDVEVHITPITVKGGTAATTAATTAAGTTAATTTKAATTTAAGTTVAGTTVAGTTVAGTTEETTVEETTVEETTEETSVDGNNDGDDNTDDGDDNGVDTGAMAAPIAAFALIALSGVVLYKSKKR